MFLILFYQNLFPLLLCLSLSLARFFLVRLKTTKKSIFSIKSPQNITESRAGRKDNRNEGLKTCETTFLSTFSRLFFSFSLWGSVDPMKVKKRQDGDICVTCILPTIVSQQIFHFENEKKGSRFCFFSSFSQDLWRNSIPIKFCETRKNAMVASKNRRLDRKLSYQGRR